MPEHVIFSEVERVLRIRLNRPEKKNALTRAMYQTLADALQRAGGDPAVRAITISGTGEAFTSGNDLGDFLAGHPLDAESPAMRFLTVISGLRKPLLAGVNGIAVGVGVTMLLHCDLIYAAEEATFQLPFVNLGLVPEAASSLLLPLLVGHHRATELFLFGDRFDAQAARQMGLVNSLHPAATLETVLQERAAALAAKPPAAVQTTKLLLKAGELGAAVTARIAEERVHLQRQLHSAEAREAMEAVLQKRAPDFARFA